MFNVYMNENGTKIPSIPPTLYYLEQIWTLCHFHMHVSYIFVSDFCGKKKKISVNGFCV